MDYSKITLIFRERAKLFTMRFIHPVSVKFIGNLVSITLLTITGVTVHGNGNNFTILRSGN